MRTSELKDEILTKTEEHIVGQGCCPDCIGPLRYGPSDGGSESLDCFLCGANFCFTGNVITRLNDRLPDNQLFTREIFAEILCSKLRHFSTEDIEDFVAVLLSLESEPGKQDKVGWEEVGETFKEFFFPEIIGPLKIRKRRNVR